MRREVAAAKSDYVAWLEVVGDVRQHGGVKAACDLCDELLEWLVVAVPQNGGEWDGSYTDIGRPLTARRARNFDTGIRSAPAGLAESGAKATRLGRRLVPPARSGRERARIQRRRREAADITTKELP
jgi:hypothetical protein